MLSGFSPRWRCCQQQEIRGGGWRWTKILPGHDPTLTLIAASSREKLAQFYLRPEVTSGPGSRWHEEVVIYDNNGKNPSALINHSNGQLKCKIESLKRPPCQHSLVQWVPGSSAGTSVTSGELIYWLGLYCGNIKSNHFQNCITQVQRWFQRSEYSRAGGLWYW